jgi:hypothetical protein
VLADHQLFFERLQQLGNRIGQQALTAAGSVVLLSSRAA